MTTEARRPSAPTFRAWGLTLLLAAGVAAIALWVSERPALDASIDLHWVVVGLGVIAAERYRVHLHMGRETHTFTLVELPMVVGLFLAWPLGIILARVMGTTLALLTLHGRRPLKLAFNVVSGAFEAAVAVLLFQLALPLVGTDSSWTYAAGLGAMVVGSTIGIVMVWVIIRVVEGDRGLRALVSSLGAGLPLSVANASLALFVVALLRIRPELVWIAVLPVATLVLTYRAYIGQWHHRNALDFLYDTAVATQGQPEAEGALLALVRRTREHLNARVAELIAVPRSSSAVRSGTERAIVVSIGPGDAEEVRTCAVHDLPLETRQQLLAAGERTEGVGPEEVWALTSSSSGGRLLLRVRGPIGNAAVFDHTDLEVVRSLTRLATTAIDRAELAEVKSAFLSAVSHELRTPLTVVVGAATTLRARAGQLSSSEQAQFLERLEQQAHRLDRLLSDLLDLDRLNRGVIEPRRRLVDLVPLAQRAVATLDIQHHEVRIVGDTLVAEVDPGLTERILENLVRNAVKYSPPGTLVTIELERAGDSVFIRVEDQGHGIPEHLRATILEPFVRVDHEHPQPGTGIGLTLVRRFAQLHDGDVWIEEGSTGGTRVVVVLQDMSVPEQGHRQLLPV